MNTQEQVLQSLLQPIKWNWSSSIRARQNLVIRRRQAVRNVYPFLTADQKKRADTWFKEEAHSGLWD
jgi:hypothetical protein